VLIFGVCACLGAITVRATDLSGRYGEFQITNSANPHRRKNTTVYKTDATVAFSLEEMILKKMLTIGI
jgi:hypothetical protein